VRAWRRLAAAAVTAIALVTAAAGPALAHGVGGRSDLPLPMWMFAYGAAGALVVSFAALAVFWPAARLEGGGGGIVVSSASRPVTVALGAAARLAGAVLLVVVFAAAVAGPASPQENLAPVFVYVVFWVGLTFVSGLVGDVYRALDPFPVLAAPLPAMRGALAEEYRLGHWPAAALLLAFVWLELVYPDRSDPAMLGVAILVYTGVVLAGAARWGRPWLRDGEAFSAFFGTLAHMAPLHTDDEGRLRLRPPLSGLTGLQPRPGTQALVLVALGSTTFDGMSRSQMWLELTGGLEKWPAAAVNTVGLLGVIGLVAAAYYTSMRIAARSSAEHDTGALAAAFIHTLVPIVFAYAVAHYFSFLVFEGQGALAAISDPFGLGWDLFGTAERAVDFGVVSTSTIAWVQVGAIVAGHIAGVVLAHDRALALFRPRVAARSQYPLLVTMVLFTVGGLTLLIGG